MISAGREKGLTLGSSEVRKVPNHFTDEESFGAKVVKCFEVLQHQVHLVLFGPEKRGVLEIPRIIRAEIYIHYLLHRPTHSTPRTTELHYLWAKLLSNSSAQKKFCNG